MAPLPSPKPSSSSRTAPEWRKSEQDPNATVPLNADEIMAALHEARDVAEAARAAAAKAQATPPPKPRPKPTSHSASTAWSLASVLIVLILALAGVTVAYLLLVAPFAH